MNLQPVEILTHLPLYIMRVDILQVALDVSLDFLDDVLWAAQHAQCESSLVEVQGDGEGDKERQDVHKHLVVGDNKYP